MKEKLKNFLLKIKNVFTEKHSFKLIELIFLFILINILTMTLSYYEMMSNDYCFNETHTEQVEESPQVESIRIDRDIKGANSFIDSLSLEVIPFSTYRYYTDLTQFANTYLFVTSVPPNKSAVIKGIDGMNYGTWYYGDNLYIDVTYNTSVNANYFLRFYSGYLQITNDNGLFTLASASSYDYDSNSIQYNFDACLFLNENFGNGCSFYDGNISNFILNIQRIGGLYRVKDNSSSTPTLTNAPTELVSTLPINALTTVPSNLGTLVYDTSSNFVELPTGSNANTLGVQIYYKSSWNQTTTSTYVEYEGNNYYYNKPTPTITLSEVNLLIYTLWDDTPIYYNVGNVLDTPLTNYAVTSFDFFNWFNMFWSKVNVIQEYNDYWHLDFDFDYLVEYQNKVTAEYGAVISTVDYGYEMLIPHNVSLTDIGYKGFSMEKFIELDSNYTNAYIWIGEQTATNFVNQAFESLYHNAYEEGDSDGFARGFELNGDVSDNAINPVFNFINKGAKIVSDLLNVEVLPNITLGTIFLFPLVIAMIWFVVKFFMGG